MRELQLTDLIDTDILQQFQNGFSDFMGLAALITDDKGAPITAGSKFTEFCMKQTRGSEKGRMKCYECDKNGALMTLRDGKPAVYRCHAGLVDFAAPIMVEGKFLGSIIGGQVRPPELKKEDIIRTAIDLGLDPEEYVASAEKTYVVEMKQIERSAQYLFEIAHILSDMAYKNKLALDQSRRLEKAARSQSVYIMNMSVNMEKYISEWLSAARQAVNSGDSSAMERTISDLIHKSSDVYTMVSDTVDYIRMAGGDVELSETMYDSQTLVNQITDSLRNVLKEHSITMKTMVSSSVPGFLLGDSSKIGQITNKFISGYANYSGKGTEINIDFSCRKASYACMLEIRIKTGEITIPFETLNNFISYFTNLSGGYFINEKGETDFSLSAAAVMLRQVSGKVKLVYEDDGSSALVLSFPQLEVKE
ncbi:MAG: PocR ligand-binding domain-containing protein [Huintestinicola sp.]